MSPSEIIEQLWDGMTRFPFPKAQYTVFKGYIDDSTHKDVFTLAALVNRGKPWKNLVKDWEYCLREKNRELVKANRKPIKRYHATDMSNGYRDFKGWSRPEIDDFGKELIAIVNKEKNAPYAFSFSVRLSHLVEVIPEAAPDPCAFANVLLLMSLMDEITDKFIEANRGNLSHVGIALIHERGDYNGSLDRAFETQRKRRPECDKLFDSITPMGWETCMPLQPADLAAYEFCKEVERDEEQRPTARRSFTALTTGIHSAGIGREFTKSGLEKLRDWLTPELKAQLLLDANLAKLTSLTNVQNGLESQSI